MSACRVCAFAQYQDETGTSQCKSCPVNTDNFQLAVLSKNNITDLDQFVPKSVDDCLPKVGYFGWPGVPATECPAGARTLLLSPPTLPPTLPPSTSIGFSYSLLLIPFCLCSGA